MQNRGLLKYKLHHLFFWMLVFALWYYLRYQDYATEQIAFQITLVKVIDLALIIYITNYLLIPKLLYKKRYISFVAAFLIIIVASGFVKMFLMAKIIQQPGLFGPASDMKTRLYENVISDFFLVAAGAAFKLMFDYSKMQQRLAEVGREKAEAELNFLKSQINPHFLFNSLNSVYFLIDKNNAEARGALHKFSEMLRYQLYEMNGDKIPVEKELSYLKDYIDLQKLRSDENYSVLLSHSPDVKEFSIEPLLLIPFVENAFKHISHFKDKTNFIKLDLSRSNGEFHFTIENSKEAIEKNRNIYGGIGLNNVKRRLELLYADRHRLEIVDGNNLFKVDLKIKI
jgi:two-component system LytT family sensor kinase